MSAEDDLRDHALLGWLDARPAKTGDAAEWADASGMSRELAETSIRRLRAAGNLIEHSRLAGKWYQLSPAGSCRREELSQPAVQKSLRAAYCRDTWITKLYAGDHLSVDRRLTPSSHYSDPDFAWLDLTLQDHERALSYLEGKGFIESMGTSQNEYLFVYLTHRGQDCAEAGEGVSSYLRQAEQPFMQNNTFNHVGAAAAGRDHVTAVQVNHDSQSPELTQLREQIEALPLEDREEGLVLLDDAEAEVAKGDESKIKVRLKQLGAFAGRIGERALSAAVEGYVRAHMV